MTEILLRNEPTYPIHVIPQCWNVFNQRNQIERGLFFLDGQKWYEMRKKMNPIFLKNPGLSLAASYSKQVTDKFIEDLKHQIELKGFFQSELETLLHKWSVESTLASIYGNQYNINSTKLDEFVGYVHDMFDSSAILQTTSADEAAELNSNDWQNFSTAAFGALQFLNEHFNKLPKTDGLAEILDQCFNEEEIIRIVNDLIIAAADTTSYTTLWALYLMAIHESYQKPPIISRSILRECMRLYPVAPFLTRIQQKPLNINGYEIMEGQLVLISAYAMGRDVSNFPNPDNFQPERWLRKSNNGKINSFASLPFGFGSRSCIGKKMAEQQMEYFLEQFFKNFNLHCVNDQPVKMIMRMIGLPDVKILFNIKLK